MENTINMHYASELVFQTPEWNLINLNYVFFNGFNIYKIVTPNYIDFESHIFFSAAEVSFMIQIVWEYLPKIH